MSKIVTQWMREEFAEGKLENIPAAALAILKAEAEARKEVIVPAAPTVTAEPQEEEA